MKPGSAQFKGGLPVGAKWSDTNSYTSYITPFVFSYSLALTPAGCPAASPCPAVTKTADAWNPLNAYQSLKAIRDLFSVGQTGEVDGNIDLGSGSPEIMVWATFTKEGGDLTLYQYYAQDLSSYDVSLDWQGYTADIHDPYSSTMASLDPGQTMLLRSFVSNGVPYETGGEAYAVVNGQDINFIAPTITSVPEPSTWAMLLIGWSGLGFAAYRRARRTCGKTPASAQLRLVAQL